jgi:hypothetical protein
MLKRKTEVERKESPRKELSTAGNCLAHSFRDTTSINIPRRNPYHTRYSLASRDGGNSSPTK